MTELWRVLDDHPAAPGHLVRQPVGNARCLTACGWATRAPGVLIDRATLLRRNRFACSRCLRSAKRIDGISAAVNNNRGGRP